MRKEYKIAIVEDDPTCLGSLCDMLDAYGSDNEVKFDIESFRDIETFLAKYRPCYDIVFMDIELPGMNGMDGARCLRKVDPVVVLIFITHMAQFAVQGYEVSALDYIVKPVTYKNLCVKLARALTCMCKEKNSESHIVLNGKNGIIRLDLSDIIYIEVRGHHLYFHLTGGREVDVCGTLYKLAEQLAPYNFALCNSCFLLNMKYIDSINALSVNMSDGTVLQISKRRKKPFLDEFARYVGKTCN